MPIRLLAIDLDGTLLTSGREPHPESARAIRRAVAEGVTVALSSGRIRTSMLPFAEQIGLNGPMISCNGAYIEDEQRNEIAYWPLSHQVFDSIWPYVLEQNVHMNVYTATELLFLQESPFGAEYVKRLNTIQPRVVNVDSIHGMKISKVLVMDHPERIVEHRKVLDQRVDPALAEATLSEPDYLEYLATGISKGKALKLLAEHLGIDQSETAAIGDYLNDLEMIRYAGLSASVANGHEELRREADVVVGTNDDAGVCEFIERYVLG